MKIKVYGSKGTIPFFNNQCLRTGGNTSCVKLETAESTVILDCGSGLAQLNAELQKDKDSGKKIKLDILLSHLHLDHIIGLGVFKPLWDTGNDIRLFTKSRGQLPLASQVFGVFKPPYWPIDLGKLCTCRMIEINDNESFMLNDSVKATTLKSSHMDGTTAFRIEAEKTVVYLLDYEITGDPGDMEVLSEFCAGSDLVIFDSCYLPRDIEIKRGWGHSTFEAGIELAEKSGCKQMLFSHLSFEYTDSDTNQIAECIRDYGGKYLIAFDGMELEL